MGYVLGAIVGILYGGIACVIKYLCLWKPYIRPKQGKSCSDSSIYGRMGASYGINVAVLLIAFLARDYIPHELNWVALIIAAALSLSVFGKFYSIDKINKKSTQ